MTQKKIKRGPLNFFFQNPHYFRKKTKMTQKIEISTFFDFFNLTQR